MKHTLIDYLNVLWATKDVAESLRNGDANLVTNDERILSRIGLLSDNIDQHIGLTEQMSNVLASGLGVMQSIYNNQLQSLNNRFALVTAYHTVLGTCSWSLTRSRPSRGERDHGGQDGCRVVVPAAPRVLDNLCHTRLARVGAARLAEAGR
jgi:hypothetical protein